MYRVILFWINIILNILFFAVILIPMFVIILEIGDKIVEEEEKERVLKAEELIK